MRIPGFAPKTPQQAQLDSTQDMLSVAISNTERARVMGGNTHPLHDDGWTTEYGVTMSFAALDKLATTQGWDPEKRQLEADHLNAELGKELTVHVYDQHLETLAQAARSAYERKAPYAKSALGQALICMYQSAPTRGWNTERADAEAEHLIDYVGEDAGIDILKEDEKHKAIVDEFINSLPITEPASSVGTMDIDPVATSTDASESQVRQESKVRRFKRLGMAIGGTALNIATTGYALGRKHETGIKRVLIGAGAIAVAGVTAAYMYARRNTK